MKLAVAYLVFLLLVTSYMNFHSTVCENNSITHPGTLAKSFDTFIYIANIELNGAPFPKNAQKKLEKMRMTLNAPGHV